MCTVDARRWREIDERDLTVIKFLSLKFVLYLIALNSNYMYFIWHGYEFEYTFEVGSTTWCMQNFINKLDFINL